MIIQSVARTGAERVWAAFTNRDAATLTANYTAFWLTTIANTASANSNDAALPATVAKNANAVGSFAGLVYLSDVAKDAVGLMTIYGYHESAQIFRIVGSVTVVPGDPMGPGDTQNSIGISSVGHIFGKYGPIVALDTVTATMHSLGTVTTNFANHVFIRGM